VDVFFVLSGFLITGILLDTLRRPHYFRNFYGRRALRILPLYYAVLCFAFVVLPRIAPWSVEKYASVNADAIWYWLHLSNFSIARRGAFVHGIVDVSWSLAIEEQFYLLWPAIVLRFSSRGLRSLCLGLMAVSVASRIWLTAAQVSPVAIYTLTFCRFDGLAMGALTALVVRGRDASEIRTLLRRGLCAICPLCLLFAVPLDTTFGRALKAGNSYFLVSSCTACAILAILSVPKSFMIRPLEWSALRAFGRYSYALYLFHNTIAGVLRDFVLRPSRMPLVFGSSFPSQFFFYLAAGGASLGAAALSWHLYEERFLRLKRFFV